MSSSPSFARASFLQLERFTRSSSSPLCRSLVRPPYRRSPRCYRPRQRRGAPCHYRRRQCLLLPALTCARIPVLGLNSKASNSIILLYVRSPMMDGYDVCLVCDAALTRITPSHHIGFLAVVKYDENDLLVEAFLKRVVNKHPIGEKEKRLNEFNGLLKIVLEGFMQATKNRRLSGRFVKKLGEVLEKAQIILTEHSVESLNHLYLGGPPTLEMPDILGMLHDIGKNEDLYHWRNEDHEKANNDTKLSLNAIIQSLGRMMVKLFGEEKDFVGSDDLELLGIGYGLKIIDNAHMMEVICDNQSAIVTLKLDRTDQIWSEKRAKWNPRKRRIIDGMVESLDSRQEDNQFVHFKHLKRDTIQTDEHGKKNSIARPTADAVAKHGKKLCHKRAENEDCADHFGIAVLEALPSEHIQKALQQEAKRVEQMNKVDEVEDDDVWHTMISDLVKEKEEEGLGPPSLEM